MDIHRRRPSFTSLVTALGLVAMSVLAYAEISSPIDLEEPMNFRRDLSFPGYDSANGPLRAVGLCLRWKHTRKSSCENLDAQPATINASFTPATVDISLGNDVLANLNFAPYSSQSMMPEYDGTLDYRGASGHVDRTCELGNQLILIDDPAILSQFIDAPNVVITVEGADIFSMSGPGNVCTESCTRFMLTGMLIYYDA